MNAKTCKIDGCDTAGKITRGMCRKHYTAWKKANPDQVRPVMRGWSLFDRVMAKTRITDSCWIYEGLRNKYGYGELGTNIGGKVVGHRAHRVTYEHLVGPIPNGLVIDHLCRTPSCVNPAHLEPVTQEENMRRAWAVRSVDLVRPEKCPQGHAYTADNTYVTAARKRICRECSIARSRARRAKKRDEHRAWAAAGRPMRQVAK